MTCSPLRHLLFFDVESVGLYGEAFAAAYVVFRVQPDAAPVEVARACFATAPERALGVDADRAWVAEHVPTLPVTHVTPRAVRDAFWSVWRAWAARGTLLVADCGWPVEASFLLACVADDPATRAWAGPFPLLEVASLRVLAGRSPTGDDAVATVPGVDALPAHHPLGDVLRSAAAWFAAS